MSVTTNANFEPTYDEQTGRYRLQHEDGTDLSVLIVSAVASIRGVDPMDIHPPLNEAIDPDALDRLFANRPTGGRRDGGYLVFYIGGCRVTVYGDGEVVIDPKT